MSLFIATFKDRNDMICKTYEEAISQKGWRWCYLAPDKNAKWREGHPEAGECYVLHLGEPVRAEYMPDLNCYKFVGYGNNLKSVHKTDGWLPMDWFRYVTADCEEMQHWQDEDEYGDGPDYDPSEY